MGLERETEVEDMDRQETVGGNYCFIITLQRGGGEGKRNITKSWYGGCRLKKNNDNNNDSSDDGDDTDHFYRKSHVAAIRRCK